MAELKYTYALDETKTRLVHINDARKGEVYYCVNSKCDEQMSIKQGAYKRKHFYHINNGDKCSYDNYLHTLAEKRIVEWFYSSEKIILSLDVNIYCFNYNRCDWGNENCSHIEKRSFDLKQYYNSIEIEKREDGFIWDLWLTNKENRYSPMAIEIFVTHKCEDEKLKSGYKIIEIKLENEEQLDMLIDSNELLESERISIFNFVPKPQYDNENHLRILAKEKIVEWFNSAEKISLELNTNIYCSNYNECNWADTICSRLKKKTFDLKQYYNCIETDKREDGFIWDIWLTNRDKDYDPMAIVLFDINECKPKLKSKKRFIGINIKNEVQLNTLFKSNELKENEYISFYNFNPKLQYEQFIGNFQLNKFILYDNDRIVFRTIDCNTYLKHEYKSKYELTIDNFGFYGSDTKHGKVSNAFYLACVKAYKRFPNLKHCSLCKYYKFNDFYGEHICILYKKLNLKDKHAGTNAIMCPQYFLDKDFINDGLEYLSELSVYEWIKE